MSITTEQDNGILTLTRFKPDAAASVGLELAYAGGEDALEDSKASLQRVVGGFHPTDYLLIPAMSCQAC